MGSFIGSPRTILAVGRVALFTSQFLMYRQLFDSFSYYLLYIHVVIVLLITAGSAFTWRSFAEKAYCRAHYFPAIVKSHRLTAVLSADRPLLFTSGVAYSQNQ